YGRFSPCLIQPVISLRMTCPPSKLLHYTGYILFVKSVFAARRYNAESDSVISGFQWIIVHLLQIPLRTAGTPPEFRLAGEKYYGGSPQSYRFPISGRTRTFPDPHLHL